MLSSLVSRLLHSLGFLLSPDDSLSLLSLSPYSPNYLTLECSRLVLGTILLSIYTHSPVNLPSSGAYLHDNDSQIYVFGPKLPTSPTDNHQFDISTMISDRHLKPQISKTELMLIFPSRFF